MTHCETIEKQRKILLAVQSGSEKAYKELYEQWVSWLYRFVFQYLKSKDASEDVVQKLSYAFGLIELILIQTLHLNHIYLLSHITFY